MYQQIVDSAIPMRGQCAAMIRKCTAVNCPFDKFPSLYGIECKHIHQLDLLNEVIDTDLLTQRILSFLILVLKVIEAQVLLMGDNFVFPPAPLQLNNNIP